MLVVALVPPYEDYESGCRSLHLDVLDQLEELADRSEIESGSVNEDDTSTEPSDDEDEASTHSDISPDNRDQIDQVVRIISNHSDFLSTLTAISLEASAVQGLDIEHFALVADKTLVYWDFVYDPEDFPWHLVQYLAVPTLKIDRQVLAVSDAVQDESKTPALLALFLSNGLRQMAVWNSDYESACMRFRWREEIEIAWSTWEPDWGCVPADWPAFRAMMMKKQENA